MKIMLVDDSSTIRRVLKNVMGRMFVEEVEFFEAENGQEAFDLLKKNKDISLIFLDYNMPIMNGEQFLVKVRAEKEFNPVRIIMCTTEAEKSLVVSLMKKGVNGYIAKPFTPEVVRRSIVPIVSRMGYTLAES